MRRAHFRVVGRFGHASRVEEGTFTIDRGARVVRVRGKGRRKFYEWSLDSVAEWVVFCATRAELAEKRRGE
jgi:hypothetical protein